MTYQTWEVNEKFYAVDDILGLTKDEFAAYREELEPLRDDEPLVLDNDRLDLAADLVRELSKTVEAPST